MHDDLVGDLAAHAGIELYDPGDETAEPAPLEDADQADRMLRSVAWLEGERQRHVDLANSEMRRVASWLEERVATIDARIAWQVRSLDGWMRSQHPRVTVKLPNGELRTRPEQPKVVIIGADEGGVLDTIESLGLEAVIRTKRELAVAEVKKLAEVGDVVVDVEVPMGYTAHAAVIAGQPAVAAEDDPLGIATDETEPQVIPGVYFLVADARKFGYSTAVKVEPEAEPEPG